jgi:hypothetical protein
VLISFTELDGFGRLKSLSKVLLFEPFLFVQLLEQSAEKKLQHGLDLAGFCE